MSLLIPKFREEVWFDDFKVEVIKSPVAAVSDYYPFGMLQAGNSTNSRDPVGNKYLYNGKELQEDLGLETYAYEFRMYDPVIGRWWQNDPKIKENMSLYSWITNNPIRYADFMGLDSLERARAISKFLEHLASNNTVGEAGKQHPMYLPSGAPTNACEKGDCQSSVRGVIKQTAGYDIKTESHHTGDEDKPYSGAYDLAKSLEGNEVSVEDLQAGNMFYMDYKNKKGKRRFHVGLVEKVERKDGETTISIIHTSYSYGPTRNTFKDGDGTFYERNMTNYYKWDRKPDNNNNNNSQQNNNRDYRALESQLKGLLIKLLQGARR